ncbi:hypothetical protein B7P43_G03565 [Cryptotermes secundus]|uniref:DUF4789 domain-containing protein n=1 Tax=Cryptotermes secundus TaxID=105785 RepID=A0A2J7PCI1_9NEOP|nr:uncharacterized protein LOC111874875 [Cryptotermes secundus]PNF14027.1 hypothetical protein B7P43_G03565 [Cryptotermes secundus]
MATSSNIRPSTILKSVFIAFCAFCVLFTSTEACDGYKIKVNKLQPCDNSGIIKLINPKIVLSQDCFVSAVGCMENTKEFSSCKLAYDVKKRGMMIPIKGERDVCEELANASKNKTVAENLAKNNIPTSCPFKKSKICAPEDQKLDVSSYKNKFRLAAGQYTGKITLDCNSGKSCFDFDLEFKRGK